MTDERYFLKIKDIREDQDKFNYVLDHIFDGDDENIKAMVAEMLFYLFLKYGAEFEKEFEKIDEERISSNEDYLKSLWNWNNGGQTSWHSYTAIDNTTITVDSTSVPGAGGGGGGATWITTTGTGGIGGPGSCNVTWNKDDTKWNVSNCIIEKS